MTPVQRWMRADRGRKRAGAGSQVRAVGAARQAERAAREATGMRNSKTTGYVMKERSAVGSYVRHGRQRTQADSE